MTTATPVPVSHEWLEAHADMNGFWDNYELAAWAQSPGADGAGKTWPDGSACQMWQDFLVGTDPASDRLFTAKIEMDGTTPVVTWEPDTPELRATRKYTILGKESLSDDLWTPVPDGGTGAFRFFRVSCGIPL